MRRWLPFFLGLIFSGFCFSPPANAECGGSQQCIAVSIDPLVAPAHGTPLTSAPLAFGNQTVATTSAARIILVGAVTGPAGTQATLDAITLSGANAAEFSISGGTCTTGAPSLLHDSGTCTITVTFNPAPEPLGLGAKTARIDVQTAAITRTVPLTGTGTGAPPAAAATTLSVQFNTATTLNLAPFISGAAPLSIRITAAPTNGVAIVSGTSVTYTPNLNYVGPDAFSYESFNSTAASGPAVITVAVLARPDPAKDPNVVGLIAAQAQTARRFSQAQISNFQRRMESLHRGATAGSTAAAGATGLRSGRGPGANPAPGTATSGSPGASVNSIGGIFALAGDAQPGSSPLLHVAREPGGLREIGPAGASTSPVPASWVTTLLGAASTRSMNLSYGSDRTDGSSVLPDGIGMWIAGNLRFGTHDQTSNSSSLRFSTDGVSAGIDRRFSDKLTLGMGLGYARDRTDIGTDGTQSRSRGSSVAIYGSYAPAARTFVDGLLGYGVLSTDTDRYVAAANDYARANRKGDQLFGSLAAGIEHVKDGLLLSPYGRLDFGVTRLDEAFESGAGASALAYFDQTLRTLQFSLGLRAESRHETSFGWALPRLRMELKHEFSDDRQATVAYIDQFAGPRYSVTPAGLNRDSLLAGIGSDFVLRSGLKLSVDYQVERTFGSDSGHAVRVWLAKDLDGKGLLSGLSSSTPFGNPVRIEAGYAWDDNLNRESSLKLSDHIYSLNVTKSAIFPVTSHTRVIVNGFVSGDKLYTYTGLDRYSGGGRAEFQYRPSGEFDAPTLGIFGRVSLDQYASELRTGHRYSFGVTARQSLTDRIDMFGALSGNWRHADNVVFDARDYAVRFNLDYSLTGGGTPYFGGEYRRGDTVSTGPRSIDNIAIAKALVQDDAYGGSQLFAYRFDARTVLWTLGYNWPLGPRDAIDFSWRHARSTPTGQPNYALATGYGLAATPTGPSSYTANQFSVVYLMRF